MTTHKYKALGDRLSRGRGWVREDAGPLASLVIVWCGREVPVKQVTRSMSEVSCVACREAYANYLSELEDVFRPVEETEP